MFIRGNYIFKDFQNFEFNFPLVYLPASFDASTCYFCLTLPLHVLVTIT